MGRQGQSITLSISIREKQELEKLAVEYGMTWGEKPNISKLVKAISQKELLIAPNHDWTEERIKSLEEARQALIGIGKIEQAREIADLLLQRSELKGPFRQQIENFVEENQISWKQQIDEYIKKRQPFKLSYRDAADQEFQFNIIHGQIKLIEKRQYLICCCQETQGNEDIPELRNNWTLRLDRIQEAAITAIDSKWEIDLQRVAVEFHLYGRLAFAYKDVENQDRFISKLEGEPPTKRVIRPIFSTFWFFRSIAPYWEDCAIIKPENVRQRYLEKVKRLYERYFQC